MAEKSGRVAVEIRGLYDGVAFWVEPDGTLVNRFREDNEFYAEQGIAPFWHDSYVRKADEAIASYGDTPPWSDDN